MTNLIALPNGTKLVSDYRIQRVLGAGGFGITYLADEIALDRMVTIKEYFPSDFAARPNGLEAVPRSAGSSGDYQWGLDRFIEEAQTLAKFNHPNIVRVYRYFRANNTGYMVLHFEEGQSLKSWLKALGRAPRQKELDSIIAPLLDALELIHGADFLHRDIAPDNVIIRKDGAPVLIDFGSARGEIAAHAKSKTVSALVKPGYSPYEQYAETSRQQGPWTDIYALAATMYHAITGKRPPDAPSRMVNDELVPAREAALSSYRPSFLAAIDRALRLQIDGRPQSIAAWRGDLLAAEPQKAGWLTRALDKKRERGASPLPPTVKVPEMPAAAVPPPPDAPGPQGGLLDFMDGLKKRNGSPSTPAPQRAQPPPASPVAAQPTAPQPQPRAELVVKRKPPRPRPVGARTWQLRPLVVKLIIGAGVASAAVAIQDKLPHFENRGISVPLSQSSQLAPFSEIKAHKGAVTSVAYAEDGRSIITAGADAAIRVWSASSGGLTRTIELDEGPAAAIALKGRRLLTGHANGQLVLWDLDRADKISTFRRNEASIWSVAFTGEPDRFAASEHDWKVALWDARLKDGPVHIFEGHESAAQTLAYSAQRSLLASGSADKTVKLWNLDTLDLVRTYRGHKDYVTAVAFMPNGRILAAAGLDGSIRLWSTASSRLYRTLMGHKGRVGSLAFSPTGDMLASAGDDGKVRLWDLKRGRTARTLFGHGGGVNAVAFSPDGKRIATAGDDGIVRLWTVKLEATNPTQ